MAEAQADGAIGCAHNRIEHLDVLNPRSSARCLDCGGVIPRHCDECGRALGTIFYRVKSPGEATVTLICWRCVKAADREMLNGFGGMNGT